MDGTRRAGGGLGAAAGVCLLLAIALAWAAPAALAAPPANDDFAAAQALAGSFPIEVTASNVEATSEPGEQFQGWATRHSIWFKWDATEGRAVTLSACGEGFATQATVYTGSALGNLQRIEGDARGGPDCAEGGNGEQTFRPRAGTRYWIQVDGSGPGFPSTGTIHLTLKRASPPPNDDFADALTLPAGGSIGSVNADDYGAGNEAGEPAHRGDLGGASIWYSWTAPRSGGAFVQACNVLTQFDPVVAVYTGSDVASLNPVPELLPEPSCRYAFTATAGTTYRIALDGRRDAAEGVADSGVTELSVWRFPDNDDFEQPYTLKSGPGDPITGFGPNLFVAFANVGATRQPGEPSHAGNPGGASIWFRWVAPITGSVQFGTCDKPLRTVLAVYTGTALGALTPVAAGEGYQGYCMFNTPGGVAFNIDAGTEYRIAVDGFNGVTGGFDMGFRLSRERLNAPAAPKPDTWIKHRRIKRHEGAATFLLGSTEPGSHFSCRLDSHRFSRCGAGIRYSGLRPGRHTFRAKAIDGGGQVDPTPVLARFWIAKPRHRS